MTEAEWLTCGEPRRMLEFLRNKASDRKLRLFICEVVRRDRRWRSAPRDAFALAERWADGEADQKDARAFRRANPGEGDWLLFLRGPMRGAEAVAGMDHTPRDQVLSVLRDLFGNPLRPVTADPSWLTSDVLALARGIYDERAFDRMPILADALQDAGCDNADILNHLRDAGATHVRGCWALDLMLGKS